MKLLIINGPNLNLLGQREKGIYGERTFESYLEELRGRFPGVTIDCYQSNSEGSLVKRIHKARGVYDGIVYNPGAHTHYSYALRDAVSSIDVPTVEVHLSDISSREDFRKVSVIAPVCIAQIKGKGFAGYEEAILLLKEYVQGRRV